MIPRPVWKISWVVYIQKFHLNTRLATAADNTNWILHASKRIRIIKIYISPTFLQKEMNTLYCSCLWHIKFHQLLPRGRGIFILFILMRPNKMLIYILIVTCLVYSWWLFLSTFSIRYSAVKLSVIHTLKSAAIGTRQWTPFKAALKHNGILYR